MCNFKTFRLPRADKSPATPESAPSDRGSPPRRAKMLSPCSPAPQSCKMFQIAQMHAQKKKKIKRIKNKNKEKKYAHAGLQEEGPWQAPRAPGPPWRHQPRPAPPPAPCGQPLLPRARRPRSAGLNASGRTCATALTRVTSGPAPRAHRRVGAWPREAPPPPRLSAPGCFALSRAWIFLGLLRHSLGDGPGDRQVRIRSRKSPADPSTCFLQGGKKDDTCNVICSLQPQMGN